MSWVPSPSGRLSASYREVSVPSVLGTTQRGSSVKTSVGNQNAGSHSHSPTITTHVSVAAPASASQSPAMGHLTAASMTRQQTAGSSSGTAAGRATAVTGFSMPSPSTAYATALPANQAPFPPILSQIAGNPYPTPIGPPNMDELSRSLTMLPFSMPMLGGHGADLLGSPAGSPHHRDLSTSSTAGADPLEPRRFGHKKSPSYTQVPGPVCVNIYWQRPVAFDDKGRAQRRLGGGDLTWGKKFLKDVLGVYHVGVEVYGQEYTFGNYRAPSSRQVGGERSGVFAHEPRRPGPHCIFKQAEKLGRTSVHPSEVEDFCVEFGNGEWAKGSYNKIHHNCVDFAKTLCTRLDVDEIPAWCYRGAAIGKLLGIGGPEPGAEEQDLEQELEEHDMSGETNGSFGNAHDDMDTRIGHHRLADANRLTGSFAGPVGHDSVRSHANGMGMSMSSTAKPQPDVRQHNTSGATANGVIMANGVISHSKGPSYVAPPMEAVTGVTRGPSYVAPPVEAVTGARGPSYVAPPIGVAQNRGPSYVAPPIEATGARGPSYVAPPVEVRGARGPSYVAPAIDATAAALAAVAAAAAAAAAANASGVAATGGARGASFVSAPVTMPTSTYVSPPSYVAPPGRPASHIAPHVAGGSTAVMQGAMVQSATVPGALQTVPQAVPHGIPQGMPPRMAQATTTMRTSAPVAQAVAHQPASASIRSTSEEKTLMASRRVTVLQSNGKWATGKIVCQDGPDKYTVIYDANWSTENQIAVNRIVALPEDSNSRHSMGQAPRATDSVKLQGFQVHKTWQAEGMWGQHALGQGLASADSILQSAPLKQAVTNHCRTNTNGGLHREQLFPTFTAPAGTSTTGGFQQRSTLTGPPTSTASAPLRYGGTAPAPTQSVASAVPIVSSSSYSGTAHYSGRGRDLGATWR